MQPFFEATRVVTPTQRRKLSRPGRLFVRWIPRGRLTRKLSGKWSIVAVIDWIDPAHWPLASLFFDHVRYEAWRAGNHENTVERCRIHSQVGKDGADGSVHVNGQSFLSRRECCFNGARRLHMYPIDAGFACQLEKPRRTRIFCVITMT